MDHYDQLQHEGAISRPTILMLCLGRKHLYANIKATEGEQTELTITQKKKAFHCVYNYSLLADETTSMQWEYCCVQTNLEIA